MGLAYLAAFLEKNRYEVRILDISAEGYYNLKQEGDYVTYGLSDKEVRKKIIDFNPQVVGLSIIFSIQVKNAKNALKIVKGINKNIITIVGGSHPTYAVEDMLAYDYVDYIVMGEGELSTLQLLNTLNEGGDIEKVGGLAYSKEGQNFINNNRQYIKNIDDLPHPARHLLDMELYFKIGLPHSPYPQGKRVTQITTSRGCPVRCVFCTSTNFWGNRYRERNAKDVIAEIRMLKEKYGVDEIQFTDDNLAFNKKRAIEIFKGIKSLKLKWCSPNGIAVWALDEEILEKMRESGCYQLSFAIESGNQKVLSKIVRKPLLLIKVKPLVKKAQELGIKVHAFFICGLPGETIGQMYDTYNFANDCNFDSASFFIATPLVGSELLKICKEKGHLKGKLQYKNQLYKLGNIVTPEFTPEKVQELVGYFNKTYNLRDKRKKKFEKEKY